MMPGMMGNKDAASFIVKSSKEGESGGEKDMEPGFEACVSDVMAAVEAKDKGMLKEALKSFMQLFYDEMESKEMESESSEEEMISKEAE